MGWIITSIVILGIILIILFMKKMLSRRSSNNFSTMGKMSFTDKMKAVGKTIGDCCRKTGA